MFGAKKIEDSREFQSSYRATSKKPNSTNYIGYLLYFFEISIFVFIFYALYNSHKGWFFPADAIGTYGWFIFGFFALCASAFVAIKLDDVLDFLENKQGKRWFGLQGKYPYTSTPIFAIPMNVVLAAFCMSCLTAYWLPHASSFVMSEEVERNFSVKVSPRKFRQCGGLVFYERNMLSNNMMCSIPAEMVNKNWKGKGVVKLMGYQNAFGFRATEIVDFQNQ